MLGDLGSSTSRRFALAAAFVDVEPAFAENNTS